MQIYGYIDIAFVLPYTIEDNTREKADIPMANTPQLLILGNGFDLHCGLKSGYADFFNAYIRPYKSYFPTLFIHQTNFWAQLLIYREGWSFNKWCDIESMIKDTLLAICFGETNTASDLRNGIWAISSESRHHINDIAQVTTNHITQFLYAYCADFFDSRNSILPEADPHFSTLHLLLEHLLQDLHVLERQFCQYLKDQIVNPKNPEQLNTTYLINAFNLLGKLTDSSNMVFADFDDILVRDTVEEWKQTDDHMRSTISLEKRTLSNRFLNLRNTHILSFNYTALFDILAVESPCVYNNVHGKLCSNPCGETCKSSNIIFGIDDTFIHSQNANTELRMFSKTYRKMSDTSTSVSILPKNDNKPLAIKFYGHSLSSADYSYFQSIFDYYDLYGNSNVRLIFYFSKGFEQTDAIYQLINSYGKTLSNQEQGKNLIHKLLLENRLKITEIP